MKYLTAYICTLAFLAPSLGWSLNEHCFTQHILANSDGRSIESILRFERVDWQRRYSTYFEIKDGKKSTLLEAGEIGAIPSFDVIDAINTLPVSIHDPSFYIEEKKKVKEVTGQDVSDSMGIFLENLLEAGVELTHQDHPTSQEIYNAIKSVH